MEIDKRPKEQIIEEIKKQGQPWNEGVDIMKEGHEEILKEHKERLKKIRELWKELENE